MKGPEFDKETIEAYLLDRLEPDQKIAFETAMSRDPLLAREVSVEQDTLQAIRQYRKAELKARLDAIEIPKSQWKDAGKIAASILLLSILGIGAYVLIPSAPENEKLPQPILEVSVPEAARPVETVSSPEKIEKTDLPPVDGKTAANIKEHVSGQHIAPLVSQPDVVAKTPDMNDSFLIEEGIDKQVTLPNPDIAKVVDTKEKLSVDLIDQEGPTRYKYYNNKVFLYGALNSEPYEILELNSNLGKELYLYFKGAFYKLNANTYDASNLDAITDLELKNQLEQLRVK